MFDWSAVVDSGIFSNTNTALQRKKSIAVGYTNHVPFGDNAASSDNERENEVIRVVFSKFNEYFFPHSALSMKLTLRWYLRVLHRMMQNSMI